ncbi:MAG TPA: PadR family transcriptional regulator [Candidatus Paceibacterota bacterium]|jgi:PadR family transcriptional regulator PadR|nr:PadR family transcriptional regulator [Candidatus Paceibacterota bacterium]
MREESIEQKEAQMRKGLLEFCILLAVSKDRVYSSDILKKLKDADLLVVEGTLYPLLSRLKQQGLVDYDWEESPSGPPRKYYTLTKRGKDMLILLEKTWTALRSSVMSLTRSS